MVVMMLLVIFFVFGLFCSSVMGIKFFIGIIVGFVFYVLNIIFGNMILVFMWILIFIGVFILSLICLIIVWWLLVKKWD